MEGMLIGQGNPDETPAGQKLEDQEYDADEQGVGGMDVEKEQRGKPAENIGKGFTEKNFRKVWIKFRCIEGFIGLFETQDLNM